MSTKDLSKYYHKEMDNQAGASHAKQKTKIVATVGPASDTYEKLLELVQAGVNVFRLNFSHGAHEDKLRIINYIRQINKTEPYNVAILADLQGPKLRVGEIENNALPSKPAISSPSPPRNAWATWKKSMFPTMTSPRRPPRTENPAGRRQDRNRGKRNHS